MIKSTVSFNGRYDTAGATKEIIKSIHAFDPAVLPKFQNDIRKALGLSLSVLHMEAMKRAPTIKAKNKANEAIRNRNIHIKDHIGKRLSGNKTINKKNGYRVASGSVYTQWQVNKYATVVEFGRSADSNSGEMQGFDFMLKSISNKGKVAIKRFAKAYIVAFNKRMKTHDRKIKRLERKARRGR